MESKKNQLDLLRDRVEDLSIASRRYQSLLYFLWFVVAVIVYGLMIGLNVFITQDLDISSTKINTELNFGNTSFVIVDGKVNQHQRSATFLLGKSELDSTYEERSWHVNVEYQNGSNDEDIKTKVYQGENDFTYIQVEGLATEWSGVRFELTTKTDIQPDIQQAYIVVGANESQKKKVAFLTENDVRIESIEYSISQRNEVINDNEKIIKVNEKQIEKNKEKVLQLEADMTYQTETQKLETQNTINQLLEQNRQLEATNYSTGKQCEELQEQIQKLEEKESLYETD